MAAVVTRKRQAPGAAPCGKKRARITFGSIHDYDRLQVLGEGTYSVVLKARHRRTGETVAVKWVRGDRGCAPDLRGVFREAACLAACRGHTSAVEIKNVAADAVTGDVFLVTELVDGASLRGHMAAAAALFSEAETRGIMQQLLRGAARVHGAGLIHRDVKPENILVGPGGALKICDFGMATPARRPGGAPYPEWWAGTLCYRSPEQLGGDRCYGTAVDMWALGCVMAELLTGEVLFDEETEEDAFIKATELREDLGERGLRAFDGLPELSQAGREVLSGLLAFYPGDRLTAAAALRHRWFAEEAEEQC